VSKIFDTETELANEVIAWLEGKGWTVHKEVMIISSGRTIDIIAEKNGVIWAVECKNTFTESVLDQCYLHRKYVHYVSAAVPGYDHTTYRRSMSQAKTSFVKEHFLKCFGIGLIRVNREYGRKAVIVKETLKPEYQRLFKKAPGAKAFIKNIEKVKSKFHELHKDADAGAAGGQVTDYKISMYNLRIYLAGKGEVDPLAAAKEVEHHYKAPQNFKQAILRGIDNNWVSGVQKIIRGRKIMIFFEDDKYNVDGSKKAILN
jgi:hypothetical protein